MPGKKLDGLMAERLLRLAEIHYNLVLSRRRDLGASILGMVISQKDQMENSSKIRMSFTKIPMGMT